MSYVNPYLADLTISKLSKEERRRALDTHYNTLTKFVEMVGKKDSRSLIVNGDAGMGKTEFTTDLVEKYNKQFEKKVTFVSGTMSPVELYCRLNDNRLPGQILVIDDTDKVLEQTESLEILKSALDTRKNKILTWGKAYSSHLNGRNVPSEFEFKGKVIIITNKLLRTAPNKTPTKSQQQVAPLLSRVNYFRAGVPSNEWKIEAMKMFSENYQSTFSKMQYNLRCKKDIIIHQDDRMPPFNKSTNEDIRQNILDEIIDWIDLKRNNLREISFRVIANIISIRNEEPEYWKEMSIANLGI